MDYVDPVHLVHRKAVIVKRGECLCALCYGLVADQGIAKFDHLYHWHKIKVDSKLKSLATQVFYRLDSDGNVILAV
jgi:hypothetical protein